MADRYFERRPFGTWIDGADGSRPDISHLVGEKVTGYATHTVHREVVSGTVVTVRGWTRNHGHVVVILDSGRSIRIPRGWITTAPKSRKD
jgi:hypothetical protein